MHYLIRHDERPIAEYRTLVMRHPNLSDGRAIGEVEAGKPLMALEPGHYLLTEERPHDTVRRYLGVVGDHFTIL